MTAHPLVDERERLKRRNTTISIVFAAVVCIVAVVMAVNSLATVGEGSEDPFGDPGAGSTGQAAPPATPEAPPEPGAAPAPAPAEPAPPVPFSSPTRNIGCLISTEMARCDIAEREWDPGAAPENCTKTWGQGVVVASGASSITCSDGSALGSDTVLEYGRSVSEGTFTCTSSEAGMRCANTATGQGFSISRKTYTFF